MQGRGKKDLAREELLQDPARALILRNGGASVEWLRAHECGFIDRTENRIGVQ